MRAVFFDLDDTLVDHSGAERAAAAVFFESVADRVHVDTGELFVSEWNRVQARHIERFLSGDLTFQEQRRARIRDVLREPLPDPEADAVFAIYLRHYEASWRRFPDVLPCLDALEVELVAVLTNGDPGQQAQKLEATGLTGRFARVIVSGEVGHAKPDPRIFQHACEVVGVEPAEALHVGDSITSDYEGALGAGLGAVWLDRARWGAPPEPGRQVIHSLSELPDLIASS